MTTTERDKLLLDILGLDNPYPLKDVLYHLRWAATYLLHYKNYDGPNYENINHCIERADQIIEILNKTKL